MIDYLPELSQDIIDKLITIYRAEPKTIKKWRNGASHKKALEIVRPIINEYLGHENWSSSTGNYFETWYPYRIHTDTSSTENNYQTFVFPLDWTIHTPMANVNQNVLYVFEQTWNGESTMFMKGSKPGTEGDRTNTETRDYSLIGGIVPDTIEMAVVQDCDHLDKENFDGLTLKQKFIWQPGLPFTFPRTNLHCSNNWKRIGIYRKLGLSIFTSADVGNVQ